MADSRTFSTIGAMRLLVVRNTVRAASACRPRMRSTTRRAFCGEIRMYLASAFTIWSASMLSSLCCRLGGLLGCSRLHRMAPKSPRRRKLAQLVPHHVLRDVHRDELLAVVHRNGLPHEFGKYGRAPRPRAQHLLLVGRHHNRDLAFQVGVGKRSLLDGSAHFLTSSYSCA